MKILGADILFFFFSIVYAEELVSGTGWGYGAREGG